MKDSSALKTISEVAESLRIPQHVLRFWETRFAQLKPVKRAGGRRYYRVGDVEFLALLRYLLYDEGYTIKGVQKLIQDKGLPALLKEHLSALDISILDREEDEDLNIEDDMVGFAETSTEAGLISAESSDKNKGITRSASNLFGLLKKQPVEQDEKPLVKSRSLSAAQKDKLAVVLADLLECKRILDQANQNI